MRSSDILLRADNRSRQVYASEHDREGARLNEADVKARAFAMPLTSPRSRADESWGFPKKLGSPKLTVETDTLLGVLNHGPVRVAIATMGYELLHHAPAPVADLPVLEVLSGTHILTDLTLGLGTVAYDYLG
jgi:acetoacetate decarboxylase